jgi:hypothetical protein
MGLWVRLSNVFRCTIILAGIVSLLLVISCNKEEVKEPDPAQDIFRQIKSVLNTAGAETIAVIQVKDSAGAGPDLQRQVLEEIQSQLHKLGGVGIVEYPQSRLEQTFNSIGITPSEGISPEDAVALARELQTGALLYASIESKTPDVHFKVYSGESGAIIFAETLAGWVLPVKKQEETPLLPGIGTSPAPGSTGEAAAIGDANSSGVTQPGDTQGP